jgi:DNA mismatch repair protein MutS
MTELADQLPNVVNVHLKATEHEDRIIFLHNVLDGSASKSYGLQVAQLAGVPQDVVDLAKHKLFELETNSNQAEVSAAHTAVVERPAKAPKPEPGFLQGDMFSATPSAVELLIENTDIDALSPRDALNLLYDLKSKLNK